VVGGAGGGGLPGVVCRSRARCVWGLGVECVGGGSAVVLTVAMGVGGGCDRGREDRGVCVIKGRGRFSQRGGGAFCGKSRDGCRHYSHRKRGTASVEGDQ